MLKTLQPVENNCYFNFGRFLSSNLPFNLNIGNPEDYSKNEMSNYQSDFIFIFDKEDALSP